MIKSILLLFFSFFTMFLHSQNIPFSIQKSTLFEDEVKKSSLVLSEKLNSNEIIMVRSYNESGISKNSGFYIDVFNNDLSLKANFDYQIKHSNAEKYPLTLGVFLHQNKIVIVDTFYDLNDKSIKVVANSIDANFKITSKEIISINKDEIKNLGTFSLQEKFYNSTNSIWLNDNSGNINSELEDVDTDNRTKSDIVLLTNNSKNAFAIALDFNSPKNENLMLFSFTADLKLLIKKTFTKEVNDPDYIFQNIQLSDDGKSIYIVAKNYMKNKKNGAKYNYEISKVTNEEQTTLELNPNEHFISYLKSFYHNNELLCLGFYSDNKDFRFSGISVFKFDANLKNNLVSKYIPFSNQFFNDKYGEGKSKELKNIVFRNIFFDETKSLFINAEEEYYTYNNNQQIYNCDDIISIKINASNELVWARNIAKNQYKSDENSLMISYLSFIKNQENYFFINSAERTKLLSNNRIAFKNVSDKKANLNLFKIDINGQLQLQEILDDEQNEVPFMVSKGAIIDNSIYFLGRKGKKKQLLKVTL